MNAPLRVILCLTMSLAGIAHADTTPADLAKACAASEYPAGGLHFIKPGDKVIVTLPFVGKTITDPKLCWISKADLANGTACSAVGALQEAPPFTVGTCTATSADAKDAKNNFNASALTGAELKAATALLITFNPTQTNIAQTHYLRLDWKEGTDQKQSIMQLDSSAPPPDFAEDSRYKLWLYTGYTYLRTQADFKDGFAELRARFESRPLDERLAMIKYNKAGYDNIVATGTHGWFKILRVYGDVGLTETTAVATDAQGNISNAGTKSRRAFDGSVGIGYGRTFIVAPGNPGDTDAFSLLGLARLDVISIPGKDAELNGDGTTKTAAVSGSTAYGTFLGVRYENETGHFQGAYSEIGAGETERFTGKKVLRTRYDGLLPVNDPGNWFRIAARLQIDTARPFAKRKSYTGDDVSGEIRLSLLFNIDVMELAHRLGVPNRSKQ